MNINPILLNAASFNINNKKIENNKKPPLSFCGDIKSSLDSDTAEIFPAELSRLMKKRNALIGKIKQADYKAKTEEIFSKIVNIQENANLSSDDKMTFDAFQLRMMTDKMHPLKEAFEDFERYSRFNEIKEIFGKNTHYSTENGGALFISKDKNLADEMAFLYPFYTRAKWDMKEALSDIFNYRDMMRESYCFDTEVLNAPIYCPETKLIADENIEYLAKVLSKTQKRFKENNRPTLLLSKDIDSMIDKDKNSFENIGHMKYILNQSCPEYGAFFLGGAPNPMVKSTEKGIMKSHRICRTIDLDEMGVGAEQVNFLKKAKADLGVYVDKISNLFNSFTTEDEKAFVGGVEAFEELNALDGEIIDKYCLSEAADDIKQKLSLEYFYLMDSRESEPFMQTKEFISLLDENKLNAEVSASKDVVEEIDFKQICKERYESAKEIFETDSLKEASVLNESDIIKQTVKTAANEILEQAQNQVKQNSKKFSKNKAFAIVIALFALLGGGVFLFKKYFHKFFKK